jgi:hypothetical protein
MEKAMIHITRDCENCGTPTPTTFDGAGPEFYKMLSNIVDQAWVQYPLCLDCMEWYESYPHSDSQEDTRGD